MCHLNSNTRLFLRTALHTSILLHHSLFPLYAAYTVQFMDASIRATIMKYTWAYLTYWTFGFQVTFLLLAVGCDIAEWKDYVDAVLYKKIKYWRDVTFTGLVVPFTSFVTVMFWGVYWIDRELVYPRAYDPAVPWWFNHSVHTVTFFMVVLETLLQPKKASRP
ncbi:Androgen-dependent TFPI-regulating protein [Eumeta japonica]|uniref:Androgen-dependent TFPI-regulating protein n=1 Tax=Eumeta variegata TaxID=151549 RepID=A0A4C1Y9A5_EUMVA|nr:Androgen-dependent TFPI-regulating protein [Eumeta japonica]